MKACRDFLLVIGLIVAIESMLAGIAGALPESGGFLFEPKA
jgi:hypothetical protein